VLGICFISEVLACGQLHARGWRKDALSILFDRFLHHLVFSIAVRIIRDPSKAEDAIPTIYLDILRAATNLDPRNGLYTTGICKELEARRTVVSPELQHGIFLLTVTK
jgi:hypothetical protein